MNISMILEMAASAGDRPAVAADGASLTAAELLGLARAAADRFGRYPAVLYLGTNHLAYPVALFGAALAGVPLVPLNYRLGQEQLDALIDRHPGALVLRQEGLDPLLRAADESVPAGSVVPGAGEAIGGQDDPVAVLLYTSGTTAAPKAALLRHRHLLATRDRGRLDADGYLFIEGRADDTIIRGGENIAPAEIEDVLLACPGISEAAVIGVADPEWGQRVVAVVVGEGVPEEIRQWVKGRLRSSKTPETIVFRPELPKTETGKLLRRVLQAELEVSRHRPAERAFDLL